MAAIFHKQSNLVEEEAFRRRSFEMYEKVLGSDHIGSVNALKSFVRSICGNGCWSEADSLHQRVHEWRLSNLGHNHSETLESLEWIGVCKARQKHDEEAATVFLQVLQRREEEPDNKAELLRAIANVSASHWNMGKWNTVGYHWQRAISTYEDSDDLDDSLSMARFRSDLSVALEEQGRLDEALDAEPRPLKLLPPHISNLSIDAISATRPAQTRDRRYPIEPMALEANEKRRFGRLIHAKSWSS